MGRSAGGTVPICPEKCEFSPCFHSVQVCTACGLGQTIYGGATTAQRSYLQEGQRADKVARSRHVFLKFMKGLKPGSLLDVGCSDGMLMDLAAVNGWRASGIDPQPESTDRIIRASFTDHQFGERFDFMTFIHSFEHMDDPRATLIKCRALLTEGGRLLIVVPNFGGWWARIMGANWQWLNVDDHRYHFTATALQNLLRQAGFRIVSVTTYSGFAPSVMEMILSARNVFRLADIEMVAIRQPSVSYFAILWAIYEPNC